MESAVGPLTLPQLCQSSRRMFQGAQACAHSRRRRQAGRITLAAVATVVAAAATGHSISAWLPLPSGRRATVANLGLLGLAGLGETASAEDVVKAPAAPKGYGLDNYKDQNYGKAQKCSSIMECQEIGRQRELEEFGAVQDSKFEKTASGARYKDLEVGDKSKGVAQLGSVLRLRYRVMRQGKRNADGLSGAASTIFSKGFGEDDGPKDALLEAKLGEGKFVKALEEGLVGMAVGGIRRVQVRPENGLGWKKSGKCASNIAVVGAVAGLPMGGAEREEDCLNEDLLPQPRDYGEKRRFARRFDESLIVEVQLAELA